MGDKGRTFWDYATEQRWFRWLTAIGFVVAVFLLGVLGYRLKPDLWLFERDVAKAPKGVDGKAAGRVYKARVRSSLQNAKDQTIAPLRISGFGSVTRPGLYFVSLHLTLDYSSLASAARNPYFKCGVAVAPADGSTPRTVLSDYAFDVSCGATAMVQLNKYDVVNVYAGQASGMALPLDGLLTLAHMGE
jgi:hypothetical protein